MRRRQIHLDFHTSEAIDGIGSGFSKENFQAMLKKGHVDSITVFSKCHHGWAYHPSKANQPHPGLKIDLLKAQIEAAHEIGVKTPVYLSAGYDEKAIVDHHEWLHISNDGNYKPFTEPGYHLICLNTPYLDVLLAQIKEVCENYDADGIFLDIVAVRKCRCGFCQKSMKKLGLDPKNDADVLKMGEIVYANYTKRVRETIDSVKPGLPVFHNGGHIRHGRRDLAFMDSHLELESLPTGGWGYDHFPMSAAYVRTLGMDYLGMTGKFHKTWGEFGGYKHPNALRYEVALSSANGACCSIGDQLHPLGVMDNATYTLIGEAYKTVEEREKWLDGYKNISDIAILSEEAIANYHGTPAARVGDANAGVSRILLEKHYLFDIIDTETAFDNYKMLILPDNIKVDKPLADRINAYVKNGGKLLATGESGTDVNTGEFLVELGCVSEGACEYQPSFIRPKFDIGCLANGAYVIYADSLKVSATTGKSAADIERPYFNRTYEHFCSHRHAPASGEKYADAVVMTDNTAYISYKMFTEYAKMGNIYTKEIVGYAIDTLLGDGASVKTDLPAQGIVTLTSNGEGRVVHTLYASPVRRGKDTEIIEDILPVYNVSVSVKADKAPASVTLVPENKPLEFEYRDGRVNFVIPKLECWQMVEIK